MKSNVIAFPRSSLVEHSPRSVVRSEQRQALEVLELEEQLELVPEQLQDYLDIGLFQLQPYRNTKSYTPKGTIIDVYKKKNVSRSHGGNRPVKCTIKCR